MDSEDLKRGKEIFLLLALEWLIATIILVTKKSLELSKLQNNSIVLVVPPKTTLLWQLNCFPLMLS